MKNKKKSNVQNFLEADEEIQEQLFKKAYVHHEKGREHGRDWDDWAKAERKMKSRKKEKGFS